MHSFDNKEKRGGQEIGHSTVITIDGPAGAGKSTVAKALAARLQFSYLDTGAMYRALTLKALRERADMESEETLAQLAQRTSIDLNGDRQGVMKVYLDGEDVSEKIRSSKVTKHTYYIARAPKVREIMVQWQRAMGARKDVVVEGRDIGTVVFPQATRKFYLDADFAERCGRRLLELQKKGKEVEEGNLSNDLHDRDKKDLTRKIGPLKKADDAIVIDSTHLSVEEVVERMLEYI